MNKVTDNPLKNREKSLLPFIIVTSLFVTFYLTSNIMAVKVISIFNLFYFDAGTITFPITYMLSDVLTEIWGYKTTRKVIFLTLFCNILLVVFTQIGVWLPSPDYLSDTAQAYNNTFGYVPRIVLGSLTGFLCGELSNSWIMERMKAATKGRHLWMRTIGSSVVGFMFDTIPFVLIAFAGVVSNHDLIMMLVFQYFSKLIIESTMGTPFAYIGIRWIRYYIKKHQQV